MTDYLAEAKEGFRELRVEDSFKEEALRNIRDWLNEDEYEPYKEQILDLIKRK